LCRLDTTTIQTRGSDDSESEAKASVFTEPH
jgi:ribonuclease HI